MAIGDWRLASSCQLPVLALGCSASSIFAKANGLTSLSDLADSNPNAATFNVTSSVAVYQAAGFPADKTVVGVPFYGRSFAGVLNTDNGLFQSFTGPGSDKGAPTYRQIVGSSSGYQTFWQEAQQVPYAYNAGTKNWISYDDPQSIGLKSAFARNSALRGVMIWELSGDTEDHALLNSLNTNLAP